MEENYGDRLKKFRLSTGLTASKFAEKCGVGKSAQSTYELATRYPDTKYWQKVAELGGDISYLITGSVDEARLDKEQLKSALNEMFTTAIQLEWLVFTESVTVEHMFALLYGKYANIPLEKLVSDSRESGIGLKEGKASFIQNDK